RIREKIRSQAKAPAPLNRKSLCVKVGRTLSSANSVPMHIFPGILRESALLALLLVATALIAWPQAAGLVPVLSKPVSKNIDLPGEILPFLTVSLHAKIPGYVERVLVDRGSVVKEGQQLV